ncbi:uncharacterized protein LY89DRAFT_392899 [Mollisia scopiformis]|uniref:Uncharacterized protein n=1 Tax=Mollisia scopiformis TaxID=149040 RepID=A0A194XPH0_MOLSC|nr:uncharacterized protein LY89DRAFT_392899 [Mollisia scopiformis]KUJ22061.1 hypothetical protein LY89DRAFT_392899 [Mollisia scopiformis]
MDDCSLRYLLICIHGCQSTVILMCIHASKTICQYNALYRTFFFPYDFTHFHGLFSYSCILNGSRLAIPRTLTKRRVLLFLYAFTYVHALFSCYIFMLVKRLFFSYVCTPCHALSHYIFKLV